MLHAAKDGNSKMKMTKEQFAARLHGREMGDEITPEEIEQAKASGLLVVYGYSDDLVEFRGLFQDEVDAYEGATVEAHRGGVLHRNSECDTCGRLHDHLAQRCVKIVATFGKAGQPDWVFETGLPHATFNIMEEGNVFCLGMVIDGNDLPALVEVNLQKVAEAWRIVEPIVRRLALGVPLTQIVADLTRALQAVGPWGK